MEVKRNEYYTEIVGRDDNGKFTIHIQNDCSQLRLRNVDDDCFIDLNHTELKQIRDAITDVLEEYGKFHPHLKGTTN